MNRLFKSLMIAAAVLAVSATSAFATPWPSSLMCPDPLYTAAPAVNVGNNPYPTGALNGNDIYAGTGATTVLTAPLICTTGASPVKQISATTGKQIVVIGFQFTNAIAGAVQFQDAAGSPNLLSGVLTMAANGQYSAPINQYGYITTISGAELDLTCTGSSNIVGGTITYYLK